MNNELDGKPRSFLYAENQRLKDELETEITARDLAYRENTNLREYAVSCNQKQKSEIERLKAEYLKLDERLEEALRKNEDQATLITELCDALKVHSVREPVIEELIQRAREATR